MESSNRRRCAFGRWRPRRHAPVQVSGADSDALMWRLTGMKFNKDQWISSFEDAMVRLRPHTSMRVLTTISLMAWNQRGTKDVDPAVAAAEWSKSMDKPR